MLITSYLNQRGYTFGDGMQPTIVWIVSKFIQGGIE